MPGNRGYTMVELVMVLTLVGALGAVALPKTVNLDRVHAVICKYQLRQVQEIVELYRLGKNRYPDSLAQLVPEYYKRIPRCTVAGAYYKLDRDKTVMCTLHGY